MSFFFYFGGEIFLTFFLYCVQAVKKGCVTPTNGTTFYDLSDLPQANIKPNTATIASLITNVFEDGDVHFAYALVFFNLKQKLYIQLLSN